MTHSSLCGWFGRTAAERHGDIALEIGRRHYPYGVLERRAAGIATRLGRPPSRVGLLTSRSIATYAGYLAVLRLTLAEMARIVESAGRAAPTAALTPIRRIDRSRYTISSEGDSSGA